MVTLLSREMLHAESGKQTVLDRLLDVLVMLGLRVDLTRSATGPNKGDEPAGLPRGQLEGQGWHQAGPDAERRHFTQTEDIQRKLDGQLLIIEGRGHAADDPERVVHWAFAVVAYDTAEARYRWAAFSRGDHLDTDLSVDNTGIEWSAQLVPDTLMRYRANIIGDQWSETAQLSTDHGTTWTTTLQMHLRKTT